MICISEAEALLGLFQRCACCMARVLKERYKGGLGMISVCSAKRKRRRSNFIKTRPSLFDIYTYNASAIRSLQ